MSVFKEEYDPYKNHSQFKSHFHSLPLFMLKDIKFLKIWQNIEVKTKVCFSLYQSALWKSVPFKRYLTLCLAFFQSVTIFLYKIFHSVSTESRESSTILGKKEIANTSWSLWRQRKKKIMRIIIFRFLCFLSAFIWTEFIKRTK